MQVHNFYRQHDLRVHEIPVGVKCPVETGWPDSEKRADDIDPLLQGDRFNKYGWLLDDRHFVIDIDVHDEAENGFVSLAKLEATLGFALADVCGAIVNTPSGGRHYYFGKPDGFTFGKSFKKLYPGIDFIAGKGKQVIAAGSSHDKHEGTYELSGNGDLIEAPETLLEHLASLRAAKAPTTGPVDIPGERSGDEFNQSDRGLQLLLGELGGRGYVINRGADYFKFNRPGKTTDSDCSGHVGKKSQSGNYQLTCFSLSDPHFASGDSMTIFHAYSALCYRGDHRQAAIALYERDFAVTDAGGVDLSGLLQSKTLASEPAPPPPKVIKTDDLGGDVLCPPGLLRDIIEYNLRTAIYPQPELALAGALSLMSLLIGRNVMGVYNTRANIFVLGMAPSGAGKEHARKCNKEILQEAGFEELAASERIASSAGIVTAVSDHPAILFQIDEIGRMLETINNPGKAPHLYNIASVLMQMYSSSDTIWVGDAYADASKVKRINQPYPVLYGTSTADKFWNALTVDSVTDGFLGRMLAFEAAGDGYVDRQQPSREEIPSKIIGSVKWWFNFSPGGNLSDFTPQPVYAPHAVGALDRINHHIDEIGEKRKKDSAIAAAIWSRAGGKTGKLALILACSRQTGNKSPTIEMEDVDRAIRISNHLTRRTLQAVAAHVSENDYERQSKRVLRLIAAKPMTTRELSRSTRWLRRRDRDEILGALTDAGLIEKDIGQTGGRPVTVYQATRGE